MNDVTDQVPVIDLGPWLDGRDRPAVAAAIDAACRQHGFFLVTGHGVDPTLVARLEAAARDFFARPDTEKAEISMRKGGRAWRGWFPVGGELTSGVPDHKEGIYFGTEAPPSDRPLHGPNLFPAAPADLRPAVLAYLDALVDLGRHLVAAVEVGLGTAPGSLTRLVDEPLVLFRIFHYPPRRDPGSGWGVGEHTDYGLLTILHQDDVGGLEVRVGDRWQAVPPVAGTFVCNIGDMLERATGGRYRSTPHRVRDVGSRSRISMPFFFDPGWDARVEVLATGPATGTGDRRWDGADPTLFEGTYGEYVLGRVAKVFPGLRDEVL